MVPTVLLCRPVVKDTISVGVNACLFPRCACHIIAGMGRIVCLLMVQPVVHLLNSTMAQLVSRYHAPQVDSGPHSTANASATRLLSGTD